MEINKAHDQEFSSMQSFKDYTGRIFMDLFGKYLKHLSNQTSLPLLEDEDKAYMMEIAQSTLDSRGLGLQEWLQLQCFKQSMTGNASLEKLTAITQVAVAFYAEFAAIEVRDDLPCFDNDECRRGKPTIWSKYGERKAILFVEVLQSFVVYTVQNLAVDPVIKLKLCYDLNKASHSNVLCTLLENRRPDDSLQRTLLFHEMKVGIFGGILCEAAAIIADANATTIQQMHKFGKAVAHCAQIDNDCEPGALADDMQNGSVNILSTSGCQSSCKRRKMTSDMVTKETTAETVDNDSDDTGSTSVESIPDISLFVHEGITLSRKRLFCDVSAPLFHGTGLLNAEAMFNKYLTEARQIVKDFANPNPELLGMLKMMERKFEKKIGTHKNDPASPYASIDFGRSLMGY
jgi:hypothetical protein